MSAYNTQSLAELQKVTAQALGAKIPNSLKWVTANGLAGLSYMLHGHIDYLADSCLPDKAEGEQLEKWAHVFGVNNTSKAMRIKVLLDSIPENPPPDSWLVGTDEFRLVEQNRDELTFESLNWVESLGSDKAVPFVTTEGYGPSKIIKTLDPGERVKTDEELRNVILRTIRNPTHGGNYLDYINWVESIPGVRKAWCQTADLCGEAGKVKVTFLEAGFNTEKLGEVRSLLNRLSPAHADVEVVKPKVRKVKVLYSVKPDSKQLRGTINEAVNEFFIRESQPGNYRNQSGEVTPNEIPLSRLNAVISNVPGVESHELMSPTKQDLKVGKDELIIPEFE